MVDSRLLYFSWLGNEDAIPSLLRSTNIDSLTIKLCWCPTQASNLHPVLPRPEPKSGVSTNSTNRAGRGNRTRTCINTDFKPVASANCAIPRGLSERIRTSDNSVPSRELYQTELHSVDILDLDFGDGTGTKAK